MSMSSISAAQIENAMTKNTKAEEDPESRNIVAGPANMADSSNLKSAEVLQKGNLLNELESFMAE